MNCKWLIFLCFLIVFHTIQAQEQIEKIFDPELQNWGARNQGQSGFSNPNALKIGDQWYFTAFDKDFKNDIWRTDLSQTDIFLDLDSNYKVELLYTYQNWLIYHTYDGLSTCQVNAINVNTNQKATIISGESCPNSFFYNDNFMVDVQLDEVNWIDLSTLPIVNSKKKKFNNNGVSFLQYLDKQRILLKSQNILISETEYLVLDLIENNDINITEILPFNPLEISNFYEYNDKYYFQILNENYTDKLLLSCDLNFNLSSVTNHGLFYGALLFIENDKLYLSDYDETNNSLGIYDLSDFSKIKSIPTTFSYDFPIWNKARKIKNQEYIISSDYEFVYYFDPQNDTLIHLVIDSIQQPFAESVITIDSGIVIRYRDNQPVERILYFPYSDLKPRELFLNNPPFTNQTKLFCALPQNKILALVYDPVTSDEYSIIDVINDNYTILKDINQNSIGFSAQTQFSYILPNKNIFLVVQSEIGAIPFIFNPFTLNSFRLQSIENDDINVFANGYNNYLLNNNFYSGFTEFSNSGKIAQNDSILYFLGNTIKNKSQYLFAYNFLTNEINEISGIHLLDKLFQMGNELYIIRSHDKNNQLNGTEILKLSSDSIISLKKISDPDECYDELDINQYYIHNGFLYFSNHGKLWSINSINDSINLLVDSLLQRSQGCYSDGVVFGNFMVKDDKVYFTESRLNMYVIYIMFVGFIGEIEQNFWSTDGTKDGTQFLSHVINNEFESYFVNSSHLFMQNDTIYMVNNITSQQGIGLYQWENNQWKSKEVLVNDSLQNVIPPLYSFDIKPIFSKPGKDQRFTALWDNQLYFYNGILIEDSIYISKIYSFKGGNIPVIKMEKEMIYPAENILYGLDIRSTQIGNKLYLPKRISENNEYYPEIKQYNLSNKRLREVLNDNQQYESYDEFIVADNELETGYFIMGENNSYKTNLYRLNSCPLTEEIITIDQLNDTICSNEKVIININGQNSTNGIFTKINGIEKATSWEKTNINNIYEFKTDLPKGEYVISYWYDNGCSEDSISSYQIIVRESVAPFSITSLPLTANNTFQYSCTEINASNYEWFVEGGRIISGLGTSSVIVDWESSVSGQLQLVISNGNCYSDTSNIIYNSVTSITNQKYLSNIFPNPSNGKITLQIPQNWINTTLILTNLSGQIIKNEKIFEAQKQLDLSDLESGVYFMILNSESQNETHRIIIID